MSSNIGEDLSIYSPIDQNANEANFLYGCFKGESEDLNVINPVPGWVYKWERNDSREVMRAERKGWEVDLTAPERPISPREMLRTGVGGATRESLRGDVILMRCPEETYRQLQAEAEAEAAARRVDPANPYTKGDEARSIQERFGSGARGPIRFRNPNHNIQHLDRLPTD